MPEKFEGGEKIKIVTINEVNEFLFDNPDVKERILGEDLKRVEKEAKERGGAFHPVSKEQMAEIFKEMGFENAKLEEQKQEQKQVCFIEGGLQVKDVKWAEETEK